MTISQESPQCLCSCCCWLGGGGGLARGFLSLFCQGVLGELYGQAPLSLSLALFLSLASERLAKGNYQLTDQQAGLGRLVIG